MDMEKYYALLNEDNKHIHEPRPVKEPPKRVLPEVPSTEGIDFTIPPEFLCPISNKVMRDPVTNCVGNTYERYHLEKWLKSYGPTDPITGSVLKHRTLYPHTKLREMINELNVFNLEETLKAPEVQIRALVKPAPVVANGMEELVEQLQHGTPATKRFAAETIATALQRSAADRNVIREVNGLEILVAIIRSNKVFTGYEPVKPAPVVKAVAAGRAFGATSTLASVGISPTRSVTKPVYIETAGELSETKRYAVKALSLAVCNNAVNQEYIRMIDGIYPLLALLRDCPNGNGVEKKTHLDPNRYTNMAAVSSVIKAGAEAAVPPPANPADMDVETRRYCIIALCNLAQNENNHDVIGKGYGNAMLYFVQCITASKTDVETKRYGVKAIAFLTKSHPYNQKLVFRSRGVPSILALLYTLPASILAKLDYTVSMHHNMSMRCKDVETRRFACLALSSLCTLNQLICDYMDNHFGIEVLLAVCQDYTTVPGMKPSEWIHFHTTPSQQEADSVAATSSGDAGRTPTKHVVRLPHLPYTCAAAAGSSTPSPVTARTASFSAFSNRSLDALTLRYATQALAALSAHTPIQTQLVEKGAFDVLLAVLRVTQDNEVKLNVISLLANVVSDHLVNQEKFRLWHPTGDLESVSGCPAVALLVSMFQITPDGYFNEIMRVTSKTVVHLIKNNNLRLKYALRQEHLAEHIVSLAHDTNTPPETLTLCHTALDLLQSSSIQEATYVNFAELDWGDDEPRD